MLRCDGKICFDSIRFSYECKVFLRTFLVFAEETQFRPALFFRQFRAVEQQALQLRRKEREL